MLLTQTDIWQKAILPTLRLDPGADACPPASAAAGAGLDGRTCTHELLCGDYHPGMRIMYPHHPVSYIGQARRGGIAAAEDSADRGTHGPGHVITLRALVKGALCRWRYYVVVSEGDSGRVLWAQYLEIARYGELLRVTAEFSMPYAPTGAGVRECV